MTSSNMDTTKIFGYNTSELVSSKQFRWAQEHKDLFVQFIRDNNLGSMECHLKSTYDIQALLDDLGLGIYKDVRTGNGELVENIIIPKVRRELNARYRHLAAARRASDTVNHDLVILSSPRNSPARYTTRSTSGAPFVAVNVSGVGLKGSAATPNSPPIVTPVVSRGATGNKTNNNPYGASTSLIDFAKQTTLPADFMAELENSVKEKPAERKAVNEKAVRENEFSQELLALVQQLMGKGAVTPAPVATPIDPKPQAFSQSVSTQDVEGSRYDTLFYLTTNTDDALGLRFGPIICITNFGIFRIHSGRGPSR
jgi:hypothetical protein